ncbi:hypothetical protein MKZ38_010568 [Zalerion maritima]|uniref:Uncharacterized protein n=1 Tax=Zalerion maritima TaxID=339359 RepID=A0AAD5RS49_9PEZI|nr:hypothetical protein MKZ38_010568 [Zalerion maritima]
MRSALQNTVVEYPVSFPSIISYPITQFPGVSIEEPVPVFHVNTAALGDVDDFVDLWFKSLDSKYYTHFLPKNTEGTRWVRQSFEQWFSMPKPPGRPSHCIMRCIKSTGLQAHEAKDGTIDYDEPPVVGFVVAWNVYPRDEIDLNSHQKRWSDCRKMTEMTEESLEGFFNPMAAIHEDLMKDNEH